jgi:hypothetical protein
MKRSSIEKLDKNRLYLRVRGGFDLACRYEPAAFRPGRNSAKPRSNFRILELHRFSSRAFLYAESSGG